MYLKRKMHFLCKNMLSKLHKIFQKIKKKQKLFFNIRKSMKNFNNFYEIEIYNFFFLNYDFLNYFFCIGISGIFIFNYENNKKLVCRLI